MGRLLFYVAMGGAILLAAVLAVDAADKPSQLIAGEQACLLDWQKYCSEYGVDHAAIHACFVVHKAQVSPACMEVVRRYRSDK